MSTKSTVSYRAYKDYKELTFTDDFMFRKVMRTNEKLCKGVIELLLDVKVASIVYKDDDHKLEAALGDKGIRLDVYLEDEEGTVFDLEMQNSSRRQLPKRARYYQSMIDRDNLGSGLDYETLPDSYIVFICTYDPFNVGLPKYEFKEYCKEDTGLELGAGTSKVFINAKSTSRDMSEDMKAFLDYLCGRGANSELTRDIASEVEEIKIIGKWEVEYMTIADEIRLEKKYSYEEGRAEGRTEGRTESKLEDVSLLVQKGVLDVESACKALGVSIEEYKKSTMNS